MSDDKLNRGKKRFKVRKKYSKKKEHRLRNWKEAWHHIFSVLTIGFLIVAAYFLIWGLIIEPNLPRHFYGPGDFKETIYILVSILIAAIAYFGILVLKHKPFGVEFVDNFLLFKSVNFNLDKYAALKRMGIHYRHRKKKTKKRKSVYHHKSITEE